MAIELRVPISRSFTTSATPQAAFELLAEVPDSVSHFPKLESLTPHGDGYRWALKKAGAGKVSIQTTYACVYHPDPDALTIGWTPIEGVGNGRVSGRWVIVPNGGGAKVTLENEIVLTLGLPRLLRKVAEKLAVKENTATIESYLENLKKTLDGGDGRLRKL